MTLIEANSQLRGNPSTDVLTNSKSEPVRQGVVQWPAHCHSLKLGRQRNSSLEPHRSDPSLTRAVQSGSCCCYLVLSTPEDLQIGNEEVSMARANINGDNLLNFVSARLYCDGRKLLQTKTRWGFSLCCDLNSLTKMTHTLFASFFLLKIPTYGYLHVLTVRHTQPA